MNFILISLVILLFILVFFLLNLFSEDKLEKKHKNLAHATALEKQSNSSLGIRLVICLLLLAVTAYHLCNFRENRVMWYYPIIVYSFLWNSFLLVFSVQYHPKQVHKEVEKASLKDMKTAMIIPVYNEDLATFRKTLASIAEQTVAPKIVYIVEDGSAAENRVTTIVAEWQQTVSFPVIYQYVANKGKRFAQAHAFNYCFDNQLDIEVFFTIDSDTVLDPQAVQQSLIPYLDPEVTVVAGLLLSMNTSKFLSKLLMISFPSSFTNGRACASVFNSVAVSCGGLASYRGVVIEKFLPAYLSQYVFGQQAMFGDDRMLTHYASLLGKTVYQETSFGYTLTPEKFSHLTRQRVRWWKSFWWGGMFIIKYHSPRYMIWWLIAAQYISQLLYAVVFPVILFIEPIKNQQFPWLVLLYMVFLGYLRCLRLLNMKDAAGKPRIRLWQYLLYTLPATLLNIYLSSLLSFYAFFMMWQVQGWGTRKKVEVGIGEEASFASLGSEQAPKK